MSQNAQPLKGKQVLVIGLGISGQSAVKFLLRRGSHVVAIDRNNDLPACNETVAELMRRGMIFLQEDVPLDLNKFNLVVVSPGISHQHPAYRKALELGIEIIGEVELACREISQKCLGVTGTNGKTTVTLFTTHVLNQLGIKARALGNVGVPLTSAIDEVELERNEVFVIELSSFQLDTLTTQFLDMGVILNISPDHLDRYTSMEKYAASKIGIEKNIKEKGILYLENKCLNDFKYLITKDNYFTYGYSKTDFLYTDSYDVYCENKKIFTLPLFLQGKRSHDVENILASFALCRSLLIAPEDFLIALGSFQKPSHRIEFVKTINGVNFYDDSKGTNIDAVIRAVESIDGKIILIAGGVDKGFSYASWINAFKDKVKGICAIGQAKEKIKNDLETHIPVVLFSCFNDAIHHAADIAQAGENVLLSPGCSSYDMFKDYAHRGQEFQRIINAL